MASILFPFWEHWASEKSAQSVAKVFNFRLFGCQINDSAAFASSAANVESPEAKFEDAVMLECSLCFKKLFVGMQCRLERIFRNVLVVVCVYPYDQ